MDWNWISCINIAIILLGMWACWPFRKKPAKTRAAETSTLSPAAQLSASLSSASKRSYDEGINSVRGQLIGVGFLLILYGLAGLLGQLLAN